MAKIQFGVHTVPICQMAIILIVIAAACYAIPMSKFDPLFMDEPLMTPRFNESYPIEMSNITVLARSKRSCCGCCCCCCCWYAFLYKFFSFII